ncbi:MAG: conjugal transfer protein TraX [Synergistaceae bacterium]|jgi:hypothetical protein|nr:conjugal transfer protein TraX [Synergistaceae bacterium]
MRHKISVFEPNAIESQKKGWEIFSGFELKIAGIVLMVLDHLHEMFYVFGAPGWLNWLGRPVAPIFLFLCAEGYHYTRSKARYMALLFAGFEFMNVVSGILTFSMRSDDLALINNIFGTLLVSVLYMTLSDVLRGAAREKKKGRAALALLGMIVPFAVGIVPFLMIDTMPVWLCMAVLRYIPNPIVVEGGFLLALMGVLFHIFRGRRFAQAAVPLVYGLIIFLTSKNVEWLMASAAIPILMYNGKRGAGGVFGKYFFYVFYPAHIYLFYIISWCLSN